MTHKELLYEQVFKLFECEGYCHTSSCSVAERAVFLYDRGLKNKDAIDQAMKEGRKLHIKTV